MAVGETDAEPVAAAEASNVSSEESSIEGMDSKGTSGELNHHARAIYPDACHIRVLTAPPHPCLLTRSVNTCDRCTGGVTKASKRKEDVAKLNGLLGAEPDEVVDKLHEDIEVTDDLPVGDAMEASLGNNVWIFSCVPRKVITMSSEDYEWKLTDINSAVNTM